MLDQKQRCQVFCAPRVLSMLLEQDHQVSSFMAYMSNRTDIVNWLMKMDIHARRAIVQGARRHSGFKGAQLNKYVSYLYPDINFFHGKLAARCA